MNDKSLDFDTVIPGHGPVSKKADLLTYRNNAEKMRTRVQTLIRQGKNQDDVAKFMTAEYNWQPGQPQHAVEPAGDDDRAEVNPANLI